VKWLVDLDEKMGVVSALAEALDLLQLPRYAAICRSATTREILNAYDPWDHRRYDFRYDQEDRCLAPSGTV
jgi:hypothetical protein